MYQVLAMGTRVNVGQGESVRPRRRTEVDREHEANSAESEAKRSVETRVERGDERVVLQSPGSATSDRI